MKTAQELFDEEFIPTHYILKSIWEELTAQEKFNLLEKKIINKKQTAFEILETSRHIIFFTKS